MNKQTSNTGVDDIYPMDDQKEAIMSTKPQRNETGLNIHPSIATFSAFTIYPLYAFTFSQILLYIINTENLHQSINAPSSKAKKKKR